MPDLVFAIPFLENNLITIFGKKYNLSICYSDHAYSPNPSDLATILLHFLKRNNGWDAFVLFDRKPAYYILTV
jgi:hypothetical protein